MVSTCTNKQQSKRQLDGSTIDLIVSNNVHAGEAEKEIKETHNNDFVVDNGLATSGENS